MKNIFEIMKEYGIDMPEDKKKDFEKSVLENYKTVADYNKQVESLNKANDTIKSNDTAMKELQDKLDAFKDVDVTELKNTIANLEKDKTRIEDEYKDKMAKRDFDDLIKDAITGAHGKNAKAITALSQICLITLTKWVPTCVISRMHIRASRNKTTPCSIT